MFTWPNMSVVIVTDEDYATVDETCAALGITPAPQVPPPVWDDRPISADACAAATKAMCSGGGVSIPRKEME